MGKNNCAFNGAQNVKMYIVVGAVPSTVGGDSEARWFGEEGFSDYKDENGFPVNFPKYLWTAACCTYEHKDDRGNLLHEIINTAFGRINDPGDSPCEKRNISVLSQYLSENIKGIVDLFPNSPQCYSKKNYIPIQC